MSCAALALIQSKSYSFVFLTASCFCIKVAVQRCVDLATPLATLNHSGTKFHSRQCLLLILGETGPLTSKRLDREAPAWRACEWHLTDLH
jgi:hypothetical protein